MASTHPLSGAAPPPLRDSDGVFIDLDGTLLELRAHPHGIRADAALVGLLRACTERLGGAMAIISGRPLSDLDYCFAPERFSAAGLHGLERRDAAGAVTLLPSQGDGLQRLAAELAPELERMPGAQLENKGRAMALHWRRAPGSADALRRLAAEAAHRLGPEWRLLEGSCVVELLPRVANKGAAVRAFMQERPFSGRTPVFIGDDLTDVDGFEVAREFGGHGIAVGDRVTAEYRLDGVAAVRDWLAGGAR